MTRRLLLTVAVVAACGRGGTPLRADGQNAASTPSIGTAFILGRVVDASSGAPIDDAMVTLHIAPLSDAIVSLPIGGAAPKRAAPLRVLVNGQGQFVFNDLPAGSMLMTVTAPGYIPGGAGVRVAGGGPVALVLNGGQHLADVTIRLWRFATIEGAIVDESGDPIPDVPVHLLQRTAGARRLADGPTVSTDDQGAFRFTSLDPGRYLVLVQSTTTAIPASVVSDYFSQLNENVSPLVRGPATAAPQPSVPGFPVGNMVLQPSTALGRDAPPPGPGGGLLIYGTTFYPGVPAVSQAEGIDVAAGDDRTGINLTLRLVHTVTVSGTVAESGAPASDFVLRLVPLDAEDWIGAAFEAAWTTTDATGAFTFLGAPPGQYVIEGRMGDLWVRSPVSVTDSPVAGLALTAHSNLRVSGRIRFAGTNPAPSLGDGAVSLVPLTRVAQAQALAVTPDGQFAVEGCEPGQYAVHAPTVSIQGVTWAVQSITWNGRDLLTQPLDLLADVSDIVITFTDRPTQISGVARPAGPPDEPLAVVVFPADYETAQDSGMFDLRTATVDVASGRYVVEGLPPGNYLVAAIPVSEVAIWLGAGPLRSIAAQASPVTLTERSHAIVDVKAVAIR